MRAPAKGETKIPMLLAGRPITQVKFMAVSEGWELHPRKVLILKFWRGTGCSDFYNVASQLRFSAAVCLVHYIFLFSVLALSLCAASLDLFPLTRNDVCCSPSSFLPAVVSQAHSFPPFFATCLYGLW